MKDGYFDFWVEVNKKKVREYRSEKDIYIEGRRGSDYVICFHNTFYHTVKVVLSVDGLNVITGDAGITNGYVVEPGSILRVPGWLKNNSVARNFQFSSIRDSYNEHNLNADANNIGVIGAMIYDISLKPQWVEDWSRPKRRLADPYDYDYVYPPILGSWCSTNPSRVMAASYGGSGICGQADAASSSAILASNVGTAWGDETDFKTVKSNTKFLPTHSKVLMIYYDDKKGLESRGIRVEKDYVKPNPFPGLYCPEPVNKS